MKGDLRQVMMDVIAAYSGDQLQSGVVLPEVKRRLGARSIDEEQAILTYWHELMRTGVLAWATTWPTRSRRGPI